MELRLSGIFFSAINGSQFVLWGFLGRNDIWSSLKD